MGTLLNKKAILSAVNNRIEKEKEALELEGKLSQEFRDNMEKLRNELDELGIYAGWDDDGHIFEIGHDNRIRIMMSPIYEDHISDNVIGFGYSILAQDSDIEVNYCDTIEDLAERIQDKVIDMIYEENKSWKPKLF